MTKWSWFCSLELKTLRPTWPWCSQEIITQIDFCLVFHVIQSIVVCSLPNMYVAFYGNHMDRVFDIHVCRNRPYSHVNLIFMYIGILIRWLLRFEFQLPHPLLSPALATDEKWPLCQFHISYQNLKINWPKVPISDFQSQFSMSKIIRNFLIFFFIEEYI